MNKVCGNPGGDRRDRAPDLLTPSLYVPQPARIDWEADLSPLHKRQPSPTAPPQFYPDPFLLSFFQLQPAFQLTLYFTRTCRPDLSLTCFPNCALDTSTDGLQPSQWQCFMCLFKNDLVTLAGVAQLVGVLSRNRKVAGSIPCQGTCIGFGFGP